MQSKKRNWLRMLPVMLAVLLTACAAVSPPSSPPPVPSPAIPPLAAEARATLVPTPSVCLLGCSIGLTRERESLLPTPTNSASLGSPARPPTTDYSLPLGRSLPRP